MKHSPSAFISLMKLSPSFKFISREERGPRKVLLCLHPIDVHVSGSHLESEKKTENAVQGRSLLEILESEPQLLFGQRCLGWGMLPTVGFGFFGRLRWDPDVSSVDFWCLIYLGRFLGNGKELIGNTYTRSLTNPALRCVKFISRGVALSFLAITTCSVQMPRTMASSCIWETSKSPRPGLHCYTSQAMGQCCRLVLSACRVTISLQLCWQESSTQNLILPIARGRYAPGRWWGLCW